MASNRASGKKGVNSHPDYRPVLLDRIAEIIGKGICDEYREALEFFKRKINESLEKEP